MKTPFRKSNHTAVLARDLTAARDYYETVMELELLDSTDEQLVFKTGDSLFYVIYDPDRSGTVLEFCVDDLAVARDKLVSKSCRVIKWEGKGKDCYMQDPFGMIFNLWEENVEK